MSLFCVNELTKVTKECAKMNPFGLPGDHRHYITVQSVLQASELLGQDIALTNASGESVRSEALKGFGDLS